VDICFGFGLRYQGRSTEATVKSPKVSENMP
jgi:hypothetical protein